MTHSQKRGFTLLELLIVITILAILSLVVILFINPVEILKKSRDVQRMSDLSTMKTAIALFLQDKGSNTLGGTAICGSAYPPTEAGGFIRASIADATPPLATYTGTAPTCTGTANYTGTTTAEMFNNNGLGWIPLNFTTISGGAPIEKLPTDPINTATGTCGVDSLYYRYACRASNNTFELDATLESLIFGLGGADSKPDKDGGNSTMRFEVGTDLGILPSSAPVI